MNPLLGSYRAWPTMCVQRSSVTNVWCWWLVSPHSPVATVPASAPPCVGRGVMGNSGLSSHFRVVRTLVWVAVEDQLAGRGWGLLLGHEAWTRAECISQVESPWPHFQSRLQSWAIPLSMSQDPPLAAAAWENVCSQATVASRSSRSGTGSCSALSVQGISLSGPSPTLY